MINKLKLRSNNNHNFPGLMYTCCINCIACSKTLVCLVTSSSTEYGHINAMLWNGVITIPLFTINKCINSSNISLPAFADYPPFLGAGLTNLYSALPPNWVIDHGMSYLSNKPWTSLVNLVASLIILSKAYSVKTSSKVAFIVATDKALPARVPPIPPTSTRSTFLAWATLSAIYWVNP